MKRAYFGIALLPLAAFGLAACPSFGVDFCEGAACGDVGDGSTSDGPIVPTGCDLTKDPKDSAACVDDTIGIFVSASGADSNSGTKSSPMKTIGAALGKTDSQHVRVYVCEGAYPETVKVTKAVGIFGGFACADWSYSGKLPKVGPTTPGYALDVESVTGAVTAEDLELDAPDATEPGGSSIAVFVTQSTNVMLKRVTANAGNGADGADAVAVTNYAADAAAPGNGADGGAGAPSKICACNDGTQSIGGAGGNPSIPNGQDGGPTVPENPTGLVPAHDGRGGLGFSCGSSVAHPGADGAEGDAGAAGASVSGSLSTDGWHSSIGTTGTVGHVAQGGGGGAGGMFSTGTVEGGGSGGCGGCGGAGGSGGGSGGSSFALLIFQAAVATDGCTLRVGGGGAGKSGGNGESGQTGGTYGAKVGGGSGCDGANGGKGGDGAGGGGGAGGNSIAIGYVGTKPTVTGGTMSEGNAGAHGAGGSGAAGNDGLPGADGIKADLQELQ